MDAYELSGQILRMTPTATSATSARSAERRPVKELLARRRVVATAPSLADVRRLVHGLPLGVAPGPALDRRRPSVEGARHDLERALFAVAGAHAVCVDSGEPTVALARRLVRSRAIAPEAAEAAVHLLGPRPAAATDDDAAEVVRLTERLVGYLDHRAEISGRRWRRR